MMSIVRRGKIDRFFDSRLGRALITLQPGELYASDRDELVYTVLGTCVSVCLFDDINRIGGINHYRLSTPSGKGTSGIPGADQYGETALADLLELMKKKASGRVLMQPVEKRWVETMPPVRADTWAQRNEIEHV